MNFFKASLLAGLLAMPPVGNARTSQQDYSAAHPRLIECGPAQNVTMDKAGVIHVVNVCAPDTMHEPMTQEEFTAWSAARANAAHNESWERQHKQGLDRQRLGRLGDAYDEELARLQPMRAAWFKSLPKPDQHFMMCVLFLGDNKTDDAELEGCGDVYGLNESLQKTTVGRLKDSRVIWEQSHVVINASAGEPCVFGFQQGHPPSADARADMMKACDSGNRGKALAAVAGPTPRDLAAMSPMERQHLVCEQIRTKISMQRDAQVGGSTGYYNIDTLKTLELENCGSNREP